MNSRVYLLSIIVALCLGHVLCRGIETEQNKVFSVKLELIRPQLDCIRSLRGNVSTNGSEVDLFATKEVQLKNLRDWAYVMPIEIGTPKQKFKVLLDSGSYLLWVFGKDCIDTDPNCKHHEKFDGEKSSTFQYKGRALNMNYISGQVLGKIGNDDVFITDGLEAKGQAFGSANKVPMQCKGYDGILGFNLKWTSDGECAILRALRAAGMAPTVSLFLGKRGITEGGEITFGGVNEALFEKDQALVVPIIGKDGHFTIQMYKFEFGDEVLCEKGGPVPCTANVDSGSAFIVGPKKIIDKINAEVLKVKSSEDNTMVDCTDVTKMPKINIHFRGKILTLGPLDYIEVGSKDCYSLLYGFDCNNGGWILGVPVLRRYYTVFNMHPMYPSVTFHPLKKSLILSPAPTAHSLH